MKLIIKSKNEQSEKQLKKLNSFATKILLRTSGIKIKKENNQEIQMIYNETQTKIIHKVPKNKLEEYIEKQLKTMQITKKDFDITLEE